VNVFEDEDERESPRQNLLKNMSSGVQNLPITPGASSIHSMQTFGFGNSPSPAVFRGRPERDQLIGGPDIAPYRWIAAERVAAGGGGGNNSDGASGVSMSPHSGGSPFYEPLSTNLIQRLRNQVLTCPLIVDCENDFDAQDVRYNLPRFDGFPPTSPEFLRMVLVEGCSLLIIDKTRNLFSRYYERRERQLKRRRGLEQAHHFIMSGLMVAAASAAFFLHRK
jgi:hypothetical protein